MPYVCFYFLPFLPLSVFSQLVNLRSHIISVSQRISTRWGCLTSPTSKTTLPPQPQSFSWRFNQNSSRWIWDHSSQMVLNGTHRALIKTIKGFLHIPDFISFSILSSTRSTLQRWKSTLNSADFVTSCGQKQLFLSLNMTIRLIMF